MSEFLEALALLEQERNIPQDYMLERIEQALIAAYKKDNTGYTDNVYMDASSGQLKLFVRKTVVDEVMNEHTEISVPDARKIDKRANLGDEVSVEVKTKEFGRIAAQTARQVITQGIREAERGAVFEKFTSKEHEILSGTVLRMDPATGEITVSVVGADSATASLAASEQVRSEVYHEGSPIRVYVVEVRRSSRGPQIIVSRTHPGLVKRLFELEVPEIADGTVEVKSISREAGSRSKLAVWSADEAVDAVGACVGARGSRVNAVVRELDGEKVDIVRWSEDPCEFVAAALSPATVLSVTLLPGTRSCRVVVPDDQLSLAIGKEGQNARLAARLTGYKVDIKSQSAARELEALEAQFAQEADESLSETVPEDQTQLPDGGEAPEEAAE